MRSKIHLQLVSIQCPLSGQCKKICDYIGSKMDFWWTSIVFLAKRYRNRQRWNLITLFPGNRFKLFFRNGRYPSVHSIRIEYNKKRSYWVNSINDKKRDSIDFIRFEFVNFIFGTNLWSLPPDTICSLQYTNDLPFAQCLIVHCQVLDSFHIYIRRAHIGTDLKRPPFRSYQIINNVRLRV